LIGMGYNVTVVHGYTARAEDAGGMSLIVWGGTCNSGDVGIKFVASPVPEVIWKSASVVRNGWTTGASGNGNYTAQTNIVIVNTNNPIVKGAYTSNQVLTVSSTGQYFGYVTSNLLESGFTVVAVTTNAAQATLYYADTGTVISNNPAITTAQRRVGLWMGDNTSPIGDWSQANANGVFLLTNAINWAVGSMTNPPTVSAPANQTVAGGQVAAFSVTASGPGPLTCQWKKISGGTTNNINGAVYPDYITPPTVAGDNGAGFQVVVTGLYGSVTSSVATLTVQTGLPGFAGNQVFSNGQLTLTWTNGSTLLSSTNLALPMTNWTVVAGAASPYTVPATNRQIFYRIKQ
jgi:hypothetical protein